jgi:serine phosphatase RsbU (regulator of sigma subunit)
LIGTGARELADGLALCASHFVSGGGAEGIRVFDKDGVALAEGGATSLDGDVGFFLGSRGLQVHSLPKNRRAIIEEIDMPGGNRLWVLLTGDCAQDPKILKSFVQWVADILRREGMRDFESDDTTIHLLSCFEQIRTVHDLAEHLPTCKTLSEMAEFCLKALNRGLPSRKALLLIHDEEGMDSHVFSLQAGEEGEGFRSQTFNAESIRLTSPLGVAMAENRAIYGPKSFFKIPHGCLLEEAERNLLVVPIAFGEENEGLGALILMDSFHFEGDSQSFGNPEKEMAQSVAVLLGLLLGTKKRAAAEKELQIAKTIQETLLPEKAPDWDCLDVAGKNRLANAVGGDFFGFFEAEDGRKDVVIADVSGHNMASAMAMIMARSQLQVLVESMNGPGELLGALGRSLYSDLMRNDLFLTVFHLTFDPMKDDLVRFRFTNAGHNPPLLVRRNGETLWLEGGGPVIGFLPDMNYGETREKLFPGDLLYLYTDGVTESQDVNGEMFGEERLREMVLASKDLSPQELVEKTFETLEENCPKGAVLDDITVVALKVKEKPCRENQRGL